MVRAVSMTRFDSTRTTVAPKSAMTRVTAGPAITHIRSSTLMPSRGGRELGERARRASDPAVDLELFPVAAGGEVVALNHVLGRRHGRDQQLAVERGLHQLRLRLAGRELRDRTAQRLPVLPADLAAE